MSHQFFFQRDRHHDSTDHLFSFIYKFHIPETKSRYILRAEYHTGDLIAIKFYDKAYKHSQVKYNIKTNKGHFFKILLKCLDVAPLVLEKYPNSSFILHSSRSVDAKHKFRLTEELENNQRYRIYSYYVENRVGTATFTHIIYPTISSHLLVNNGHTDPKKSITRI